MEGIVSMERCLLSESLTPDLLRQVKRQGFSDEQIATLADMLPERVREMRKRWGIVPVYKMVDTCAAEFEAVTPYFYSTYEQENEALPTSESRAVVIGSGPIRIGQGIEFDYCSVHAAWALQSNGFKSIMLNSNPETVSTDFDTSDRLYFESLDAESVWDILENEAIDGEAPPSVVQFGGQTAINLSQTMARVGMPILGSSADAIDIASDRHRFEEFLSRLGIPEPPGAAVTSVEEALGVAQNIGYPVVVRPSYVLGGRAMEIVHTAGELVRYLEMATEVGSGRAILIDKYLEAKECEVDAVCDGEDVLIPGIMEHIERAGVHSGDSMAIYPGLTLTEQEVETMVEYTRRIGIALNMRGLMNVQFVIEGGSPYRSLWSPRSTNGGTTVYVLEVNPRSSRTVPFISKVTGVPLVQIATRTMMGKTIREQGYQGGLCPKTGVIAIKAPVFSMSKLVGVDNYLGPEMKSTGEVMGIDSTFQAALTKSLMAAGLTLKEQSGVLVSIADRDKAESASLIRELASLDCRFYATEGTAAMIRTMGFPVTMIARKLSEGSPNVVDVIYDRKIGAVINTVAETATALRDGFEIRRAAVEWRVPCFTSLDTARAAVGSLIRGENSFNIMRMDEYLNGGQEG
jgi:carbamoyl-phosphate synthase large subunit